jgi:hypothetical protein
MNELKSIYSISFEVKLPSACSFIVDSLTFSCRCSTLHVSAYMTIFRCDDVSLFIPEGIGFAAFVAFSCTWLYYARSHLCFSVVFVCFLILVCVCENVHSITKCKKRQQKQRSRFLQE